MAVQKSKKSKSKKGMRRSHWKLSAPAISECPQCHAKKLPHRVCKSCGYYNGRAVISVDEA
ncbi:MAG: 50S ribosomal protein L32 [Clostridia bacterium]|nr:50S ribosomal protein L32 [Clostridia bacterium]